PESADGFPAKSATAPATTSRVTVPVRSIPLSVTRNVCGAPPGAIATLRGRALPPITRSAVVNAAGSSRASGKLTVNTTGTSAKVAAVGVTVGTGLTVSKDPLSVVWALALPAASTAAPAGTVMLNAPSAVRLSAKVNVRLPASDWNPDTVTGPLTWSEEALNPAAGSEKVRVTATVEALVLSALGGLNVTVG